VRATIAFVCLVGCDEAFDLEKVMYVPPDAGPDAPRYPGQIINDPTGDFDGDGEPNATDPCVLIQASEPGGRDDTDMDGVGDLCDPNPATVGDCLVLFDTFEAPTLSSHWRYDGEVVTRESGGYMRIPAGDETVVYLDQPLEMATVYIAGYVAYGANGPGSRFAVQTFMDFTRSPAANGTACSLESDKSTSKAAVVDVTDGVDLLRSTASIGNILVAAGSTAGLRWRADGCYGELRANSTRQSALTSTAPPASGVFGLRTLLVEFQVYMIAAYGRGCGG